MNPGTWTGPLFGANLFFNTHRIDIKTRLSYRHITFIIPTRPTKGLGLLLTTLGLPHELKELLSSPYGGKNDGKSRLMETICGHKICKIMKASDSGERVKQGNVRLILDYHYTQSTWN